MTRVVLLLLLCGSAAAIIGKQYVSLHIANEIVHPERGNMLCGSAAAILGKCTIETQNDRGLWLFWACVITSVVFRQYFMQHVS